MHISSYIDIKDIIEIISKPNKKMITVKYINKKTKTIDIISPNYEEIQSILNEKMKIYQKKSGKLPDIDIVKVEQEIEEKEKEMNKEETNIDEVMNLMSLYQKAVEYYSAINDPKFIDFTNKIHKLLENSKLSSASPSMESKVNKKTEPVISSKENIKVEDENLKKEKENESKNENTNNKDNKKDTNKDININNIKEEEKNKIEEKKENKNDIKEQINDNDDDKNKKEESSLANDIKKDKNHPSIKLKISDEDLKTLDVGDEEEEEEEGE